MEPWTEPSMEPSMEPSIEHVLPGELTSIFTSLVEGDGRAAERLSYSWHHGQLLLRPHAPACKPTEWPIGLLRNRAQPKRRKANGTEHTHFDSAEDRREHPLLVEERWRRFIPLRLPLHAEPRCSWTCAAHSCLPHHIVCKGLMHTHARTLRWLALGLRAKRSGHG